MSCTTCEIHIGDIGTIFEVTMKDCDATIDISTATLKEIIFKRPDVAASAYTAEFSTDGTDGKIKYVTVADDLDVEGTWKVQAKITMPTGTWKSDVSSFRVYENLL